MQFADGRQEWLKLYPRPQLHTARRRRRQPSEIGRADVRGESAEVRVIERIEEIRSQLAADVLTDKNIFRQRTVEGPTAGPAQGIAAEISRTNRGSARRSDRNRHECGGIQILQRAVIIIES